MKPIDWQELYASNQAVIHGQGRPAAGQPLPAVRRPDGTAGRLAGLRPSANLLGAAARAAGLRPLAHLPGAAGRGVALPRLPDIEGADVLGGALTPLGDIEGADGRTAFVHVPDDLPATPVPLVVMLHGCTQTAASLAAGTLMDRTADRHGFVVAYPQQSARHNPQACWNWFRADQLRRGAPEPAFIAGVARAAMAAGSGWAIDPGRVFVAGMSAGGAMATIAAACYPDLFAAVAVHSGLAYGSATNQGAAFSAMSRGAADPGALGAAAHAAMGPHARALPTMVVHGSADRTVCPVNGEQVLAQSMAARRLAAQPDDDADPARPTATQLGRVEGGYAYTRRSWTGGDGRPLHEHLEVEGLGHAWSGGAAGGSYTDPRGPSASDAIWAFFSAVAGG